MKRVSKYLAVVSVFVFVLSCITINIYFPAAAVEKAADRIVDEVWGEKLKEKKMEKKKEGEPQSRIERGFEIGLVSVAYAGEPDINVSTPAIRAIKKSLSNRLDQLKPYFESGKIGLTSDGLVAPRDLSGLALKEKAKLKRLIKAENSDRDALYLEIAKANNISPDRVKDIKRIFAKSWIKKAPKGWWYMTEKGRWIRKK